MPWPKISTFNSLKPVGILHGKRDLAFVIKLRILRRDILDDPRGPNIITVVLISERGRQESQQSRCDDRSRGQSDVIARKRSQAKRCRWPLEAGNRSSS